VSFYEIGAKKLDHYDPDPFNVYNDPSWLPLIRLAEEETDIIRILSPGVKYKSPGVRGEYCSVEEYIEDGSKFYRTTIKVGAKTLTSLVRRDQNVDTLWTVEHLLKDTDDLNAFLQLPDEYFTADPDVTSLIEAEDEVGDRGIVMVDIADPLCEAAGLFDMADYTIIALTEPELFHRLLEKISQPIYNFASQVSAAFPGHGWRIYGPEYASEPYLPPRLFEEYVVRYSSPIVNIIHNNGGFARIHSHGRLRNILPHIVKMQADGLDPIEPPDQGDVELSYVRREYGKDLVLFGNLEATDLENMETSEFAKVVRKTLEDGTAGDGRGFVLMPSASPYGRTISARTMANYRTMVELASNWSV
jgi:hypothetical protein